MNGLEVEPVGDSGLEVDQHVLGHGVPVGESQVMELGEGDDRPFDGPLPDRLLQLRILQQGRQRLSSEARQDEHAVGIDPNRSTAEAPVDPALPLLPIPLGEDPHAGIQDPDQRTTHPDQERRVEQAVLSHLSVAVLVDDPSLRVPRGSEQPPQSQAQDKVGTLRQLPHGPSIPGEHAGDTHDDQNDADDVQAADLVAEDVDAREGDQHVGEAGQPVRLDNGATRRT